MMRVAVLASGSGSNFQALVDAINVAGSAARVELLVCNVPGAKVIERAQQAGVEVVVIDHKTFTSRDDFDRAVAAAINERKIELVALAGYMRLVTPTFLAAFPGRVINIHPALLPSFPGLHAVRQAIEKGVRVTGVTVHFVDEGTDTGPIIAQAAVPVFATDDEASLATRVHAEEHKLYPRVVQAIARGQVTLEGRRVTMRESP
ncbi:MAG: phosphoribosylglycinamide formyltransferase [Archangium gephyra]|uniref:Phosphoribosylglycinamide formyltransferase n=1 Tax=Archangium gephyra TaxID=48 RepID=A0A2W5T4F3_9BACT|nr:MAG: phosphoribosylglycinamide formyltransferase [Archangium gephyra]